MSRAESVRGSNYPRTLQGRKIEEQLPSDLAGISEDYLYDPIERECVREFKIDNDCNPILYKYKNERMDCTGYCMMKCNSHEIQLLFDNIPDQIEINTIYGGKLSRNINSFRFFLNVDTVEKESTFQVSSKNLKNFSLLYEDEDRTINDAKKVSQQLCEFLQYYKDKVVESPYIIIQLFTDRLPDDSKGKANILKNTLVFKKNGKNIDFVRPTKEWHIMNRYWSGRGRDRGCEIELEFDLGS